MFELSQIILWVLWNLRPVMALEANLVHVLSEGFALFRDDETLAWMAEDPDHAVIVLAGLADAHVKLDLLIYLRASIPTLVGQIHRRGRDYETSISIDYLSRLNERYEAWISKYTKGNLLIVDVDNLNIVDKKEDLGYVIDRIDAQIHGLF